MKKIPKIKKIRLKIWSIKTIFILLLFLYGFIITPLVNAAYNGGINIGDHYSEFDQAARASEGNGWVYVMMTPSNASQINQWLAIYPNIKLIIRGHVPDSGGNTLTAEYANAWAEALSSVSKQVYFMPVNEPNNPSESMTGIPASVVVNYVSALKNALTTKNILGSKVILLSPTIDIFTLSDQGADRGLAPYISALGGWPFFEQFSGIALNLYGQFKGGVLDPDAPLIKKGQGYREFLQSHFGASSAQANAVNIYAVETGVLKVEDLKVKYKENSAEIVSYLNTMKPIWGNDPNFSMFAIFSYDPSGDRNPWIYNDSNVLASMDLKNVSVVTPTVQPADDFGEQVGVFTQGNMKFYPRSVQDENKVLQEKCPGGVYFLNLFCIPGSNPAKLTYQTRNWQEVNVTRNQAENSVACNDPVSCGFNLITNFFTKAINPQLNEPKTGSLNAYRPGSLEFSQIADSGNKYVAQNSQETKVLGTVQTPQSIEEDSFLFSMKINLPRVLGQNITAPTSPPSGPQETPTPGGPTQTPIPGQPTATPIPGQPSPPAYTCNVITDEDNYCSVTKLSKFFSSDQLAREASMICLKETGGNNPLIDNKSCRETEDGTDYSIGLFQINLYVYHPEAITYKAGDNPPCTIVDQEKLTEWENYYKDPDKNIRKAVDIRTSWGNWCAWKTASRMCGIDQCP